MPCPSPGHCSGHSRAALAEQGVEAIKAFFENRREQADSDEKRVYNKSTLLWEADHYEAYKLMETLRV